MRPGDLLEQRYRLVRVLGRGRSGSVWCARNELIDRAVAIKILHRSLASDTERLQRFFQEARACGRVRHPAVVEVLDLGQGDDGVLFLVMELLEGETLSSLLARRGSLGIDETLSIMIPLARGLGAAHAHGILHRDLKPANIFLHKTPTGGLQPKILDFGISKILGSDLTQSGVVLGTPSYMSPEQARGVPDLDPRMDVWSLGVIAYECLAGRLPFTSREYRTLVEEILDKKPTPIVELASDVPVELARVIDEALEKSRERRLPSAAAFAQKLTAILRARGNTSLLHEPDDEFSDGAPTLAQDRDFGTKPAIDDTVGDGVKLAAVKPSGPRPSAAGDRPNVRPAAGTPIVVSPSASTAALAAQTAGSKRVERVALPRPAAGTPARRTNPGMSGSEPGSPEPSVAVSTRSAPAKAARAATLAWETNVGKAASGRDEMTTEEPRPVSAAQAASIASARIRVDDQWDTTVADVAQDEMEKGEAPVAAARPATNAAAVSPAASSAGEPSVAPVPATSARRPALELRGTVPEVPNPNLANRAADAPNKSGAASAQFASMGAIPGFTTAPAGGAKRSTPPPKPSRTPPALQRQRTVPPGKPLSMAPPRAAALDELAAAPNKSRPPRPPPKSVHPGRNTLRPQGEGFAMPRSTPPPTSDAPLIAPELFALQDPPVAPAVEPFGDRVAAQEASSAPPPSSGERPSIPAVGPYDNLEDTDRRPRGALPIVPILAAAVAVVFVFGAILGTVAARSRSVDPRVRRFANAEMIIIAWHDRGLRVDAADADARSKAEAETARLAALQESEDKAAAAASASASAAASASSAPTATTTASKPPSPAWKPSSSSGKPKAKPKPKATTTTAKPAGDAPTPTKKKGEKEWWEKKF